MKNMMGVSKDGDSTNVRHVSKCLDPLTRTPVPLTYRNLFKNDIFESIDRNAFMVSKNISESLEELIKNLFFSTTFNDLMKIRSIFAWLSFVDVDKLEYRCDQHGLELCQALNYLKFGGSYSEAFMSFASYIGIRAVCIKGWAKGNNCLPDDLKRSPANHSWNAVEIQNKWFLLDCYWSKSVSGDGVPEIEDFYFFVDPKNMIYSHYPESSKWQLLTEEISFESFIDMPALKPDFFKLQLSLFDNSSPLVSEDGVVVTTLLHKGNTFFMYKIQKLGISAYRDDELKRLIFEELDDDRVTYYFQVPDSGKYILKIFASNEDYSLKNKYATYKEVAEFILAGEPSTSITSLPIATDASWGISKSYSKYLHPSMSSAIFLLKINENKTFSIPKSDKIIFLKVSPTRATKANISVEHLEEETRFNILLNGDVPDMFGVEIYAADIKHPKVFSFIGQFIVCSENSFKENKFLNQFYITGEISSSIDKTSNNETINKLREIFLVVTEGHNDRLASQSTLSTLNKIDSGEMTCAHAFEYLCRINGYCCTTVPGILKNGTYDLKSGSNHMWNAVSIDGCWHLVDCELRRNGRALIEQNNEDYFLTEPKHFIYTHFPLDVKWQLLDSPISYEDFQNLVNIRPAFFKFNLSLERPLHNNMTVSEKTEIIIKQNIKSDLSFAHSLIFLDNPKIQLDNCVIQYAENVFVIFKLRLPLKGSYQFVIYAKELGNKNFFQEICEFKVRNQGMDNYSNFFVPSSGHWGYSDFAKKHGFKYSPELTFIETSTGVANVSISAPTKFKFHVELINHKGEAVENCVGLIQKPENYVEIIANCPEIGEYCLKVYAKDLEIPDSILYVALQICIVSSNVSIATGNEFVNTLSKLPFGFLGPQPCNQIFGTIFLSDSDMVVMPRGNIVKLTFLDRLNLNLYSKLVKIGGCESKNDLSSFVLKQKKRNVNNFIVALPSKGIYVFQLYASEGGDNFLNVYNVLMCCSQTSKLHFEFPSQLCSWNGFIYGPLQKYLNKENIAEFELEIADASNVIFMTDSGSIPFTRSDRIWNLRANLAGFNSGCRAKICSQVPDNTFHELLEYVII